MINKIVVRLVLALMVLSLVSCDNDDNDYIKVDDIMAQEGTVIGTLVGLSFDSIQVDEVIDLRYSYVGENTVSLGRDSILQFSLEYTSSPLGQRSSYCSVDFRLSPENGEVQLDNFYFGMSKLLNDHQLLNFHLSDESALILEDFVYDANSHTISGRIFGNQKQTEYFTGKQKQSDYDIDLKFDVKVWEELK